MVGIFACFLVRKGVPWKLVRCMRDGNAIWKMNDQPTAEATLENQAVQAAACMRDPYWDVVKGLLIILMVLGHALQFAAGGNFWGDPLWMGIYLFHMPLFALVSGCFVFQSIRRHGGKFIGHIAGHLLVPAIFTAVACLAIRTALSSLRGKLPKPRNLNSCIRPGSWCSSLNAAFSPG